MNNLSGRVTTKPDGTAPASTDEFLYVVTPTFDGGRDKWICRWRGGPVAVGDPCVVLETDQDPWALGVGGQALTPTVASLDARLDVLEALPARARGVGTLTWPGSANASNTLTITHGLGVAPSHIFATGRVPVGNALTRGLVVDFDPTTFTTMQAQCRGWMAGAQPAAASTMPFSWEAIV